MEDKINSAVQLYLELEDIMLLLRREKSWCYSHMAVLRDLYPEKCKNGKMIPTNVLADYHNLSMEDIGSVLSESKSIP